MMRSGFAAVLVLAVLAGGREAGGAAWTEAEGRSNVVVQSVASTASRSLDGVFAARPASRYDKWETGVLWEYGVREGFTAILGQSLRWAKAHGTPEDTAFGLGYTEFGARVRLWSSSFSVFSVQGLARLPGMYDERARAEVGNTDPQLDVRLLFGHGFRLAGREAFADVQAGYRHRFDAPPSEWRNDLTLGVRFVPGWLALAQNFLTVAQGSGGPPFGWGWSAKAQFSLVREFDAGWALQLGVLATWAGKDALAERGLVVGLWKRF